MKMTNRHNLFAYRLWAPVYDTTLNRVFIAGRKRAWAVANLQAGERVLLVGAGTGADFPLLPAGVWVAGIDLSRDMLAKARARLPLPGCDVALARADACRLPLPPTAFDVAVLNLILSVVPDAGACLTASLRALRPGGRAVIFDKFLPDSARLSAGRRLTNTLTTVFGTDINRRLGDMLPPEGLWKVVSDEPSIGGGLYRVIVLRRTG